MGKNKMIAKSCPKCEMQVAVASKACKCGHTFFAARRGADSLPAVEDIKRRTGRVRRSQPQFYDAQIYQKQIKRRSPKKRSLSNAIDEDYKGKDKETIISIPKNILPSHSKTRQNAVQNTGPVETATARARRRRALRRAARGPRAGSAERGRGDREPAPALRPAQLARCSLILQEINRKMTAVTWQPQETL